MKKTKSSTRLMIEKSIEFCNQMGIKISLDDYKKYGAKIYYSYYEIDEKANEYFVDPYYYRTNWINGNATGYACLYCLHKDETIKECNLVGSLDTCYNKSFLSSLFSPYTETSFKINENNCLVLSGDAKYVIPKISGYGKMKLLWIFLYNNEKLDN